MIYKTKTNLPRIVIFALIASFCFIYVPQISFAKKAVSVKKSKVTNTKSGKKKKSKRSRRSYNPSKTRAEAIEVIRSNEQISALAGLETTANDLAPTVDLSNQDDIIDEPINMDELEKEDDVTVDVETFKMLWLSYVDEESDDDETTAGGVSKKALMQVVMDWLGTPYRFGGKTRRAIDCSGFTQTIFYQSTNVLLPRTAREQVHIGAPVSKRNLEFGDLIFFHTYSRKFASHVGIYLGDNMFVHAGSRAGVTVSSLESTYYTNRFIGGRRVFVKELARNANQTQDDNELDMQ